MSRGVLYYGEGCDILGIAVTYYVTLNRKKSTVKMGNKGSLPNTRNYWNNLLDFWKNLNCK